VPEILMGEADPELFAYTLTVARLGETAKNNHAAVMNTVFKALPLKWIYEAATAGAGPQPIDPGSNI